MIIWRDKMREEENDDSASEPAKSEKVNWKDDRSLYAMNEAETCF